MRPDSDPAAATTRWRSRRGRAGLWTLGVLVAVFALIGFLTVTRGTAVRHVRGVTADGSPVAVSDPEFPLAVTMLTGAWMEPGHRVEVMLSGATYDRLWADLRSARRSITLQHPRCVSRNAVGYFNP